MALTTTNYAWDGLVISPYAKITTRSISDYMDGETKKYRCDYNVNVYTTSTKAGDVKQEMFNILNSGEDPSITECYTNLKTTPEFSTWTDC
jgi:glutaredoxin-related protein